MLKNARRARMDLQAKISLVLVAVILPTFLIVTFAERRFTQPLLEEEMRKIGVAAGKTLASEIVASRMLSLENPAPIIERRLQEFLYTQPNIVRMDVLTRDPLTGRVKIIASNVEDDPISENELLLMPLMESPSSSRFGTDTKDSFWEIFVPIESRSRDARGNHRILGSIHVVVSLKLVERIAATIWKATATAAMLSVITLILALSYFLRKTLNSDRLLRRVETQNVQLTEQLHEAQRQLMNTEKLAVMGQLTASFAHEIGTPLNAIGGHLQLLQEDLTVTTPLATHPQSGRLEIINGQLSKIEQIVKGFLQSTAKPASQRQLVDLNRIVDQTLGIVGPRLDAIGIEVSRQFDRTMGPVRVVPLDIEQVLLNLVNNSLDSLSAKRNVRLKNDHPLKLAISTDVQKGSSKEYAVISIYDTGEGIKKSDLANVLRPFFTTKRPGEGTGLGLAICQQLAHKYGGMIKIDSKEGSWTRVVVHIPYNDLSQELGTVEA